MCRGLALAGSSGAQRDQARRSGSVINQGAPAARGPRKPCGERREERQRLAGELHDEVLPALFKVHLMGEVVKRDLESGKTAGARGGCRGLLAVSNRAQHRTPSGQSVGSLRESPSGVAAFAAALTSLVEGLDDDRSARGSSCDLTEVTGMNRSQTVAYQVVREAVTNAAKYSRAALSTVRAETRMQAGTSTCSVSTMAVGFDASLHAEPRLTLRPRPDEGASRGGGWQLLD